MTCQIGSFAMEIRGKGLKPAAQHWAATPHSTGDLMPKWYAILVNTGTIIGRIVL